MSDLPEGLLARLEDQDRDATLRAVNGLVAAYSEQYARERRAFDKAEGDDGFTFALNLRQHGWARIREFLGEDSAIVLRASGLKQWVCVGPLVIRPYRLGSQAPLDIHHERLDATSQVKQLMGLDNAEKAQLTLDLRQAISVAEPDQQLLYAPNQLVFATYGNPISGREAIFIGAPLDIMYEGSYWRWVHQLSGNEGADEEGLSQAPTPPSGPAPYDAGEEPLLPLSRRGDDERREQQ